MTNPEIEPLTSPSPSTTDWVPLYNIGPPLAIQYDGDWVSKSYVVGEMVVYNGITYICVQPTSSAPTAWPLPPYAGMATVASTVAGLGTGVDGKVGQLRLGASPFDFVKLTYDATYAHWVSDEKTTGINNNNASVAAGAGIGYPVINLAETNFGARLAAGLTPQVRSAGMFYLGASGAFGVRIDMYHVTVNATDFVVIGNTPQVNYNSGGGVWVGFDSGWLTLTMPSPGKDILVCASPKFNAGASAMGINVSETIKVRWIG